MKSILMLAAAVISGMAAALPVIRDGSVTFSQEAATGRVTIGYTLDGDPGVVTVDVLTNGVSIGGENLRRLGGDVNRKIETTGAKTITWIPDQAVNGFKLTDADVKAVVTAWPTNNLPDYLVVDLSLSGKYYFYPNEGQLPHGVTSHIYRKNQLVMRKIPAAGKTFRMGSPTSEAGRVADDEKPHYVSFTNDFYLGIFELTKGQARSLLFLTAESRTPGMVLPYTPEYDEYPCEGVDYANLRGSQYSWPKTPRGVGNTGMAIPHARQVSKLCIDLPTDAEWEFACRAGVSAARYDGTDDDSTLDDLAWYSANSGGTMQPVGLKKPNAWGLYDMYGNAREWTLSWYERYDECSHQVEPIGWVGGKDQDGGDTCVTRGGAFDSEAVECRSAARGVKSWTVSAGMGARAWCEAVIP
jgi:formylglycine-generating enzyme required for sulfatase activity